MESLRDWWEEIPQSVERDSHGEGESFSEMGFVKILANGGIPSSTPPTKENPATRSFLLT